jgi:hypothetical protein
MAVEAAVEAIEHLPEHPGVVHLPKRQHHSQPQLLIQLQLAEAVLDRFLPHNL